MFIIEGADDLGKTTAAKRMVKLAGTMSGTLNDQFKFPIRYQHMSRPNPHFDFFHDYRDMIGRWAVQDRFHLGALAWHEVEETKLTHDKLKLIEGLLASVGGCIVIFINSDYRAYEARLKESRKTEMFEVTKILEGNVRYNEHIRYQSNVDVMWDIAEVGYPTDDTLTRWIAMWCSRLQHLPRF